jgi:hypothetical protein
MNGFKKIIGSISLPVYIAAGSITNGINNFN